MKSIMKYLWNNYGDCEAWRGGAIIILKPVKLSIYVRYLALHLPSSTRYGAMPEGPIHVHISSAHEYEYYVSTLNEEALLFNYVHKSQI